MLVHSLRVVYLTRHSGFRLSRAVVLACHAGVSVEDGPFTLLSFCAGKLLFKEVEAVVESVNDFKNGKRDYFRLCPDV